MFSFECYLNAIPGMQPAMEPDRMGKLVCDTRDRIEGNRFMAGYVFPYRIDDPRIVMYNHQFIVNQHVHILITFPGSVYTKVKPSWSPAVVQSVKIRIISFPASIATIFLPACSLVRNSLPGSKGPLQRVSLLFGTAMKLQTRQLQRDHQSGNRQLLHNLLFRGTQEIEHGIGKHRSLQDQLIQEEFEPSRKGTQSEEV